MRRGELYAYEIRIRIVRLGRQVRAHCFHDAGRIVRTGDGEHGRVHFSDEFFFDTQTTCDHDLAVLGQRLADRVERFLHRGVDEAAGVDDDEVSAGVIGRGGVTLGAQLREDALRVDERLRTA